MKATTGAHEIINQEQDLLRRRAYQDLLILMGECYNDQEVDEHALSPGFALLLRTEMVQKGILTAE